MALKCEVRVSANSSGDIWWSRGDVMGVYMSGGTEGWKNNYELNVAKSLASTAPWLSYFCSNMVQNFLGLYFNMSGTCFPNSALAAQQVDL